MYPQAASGTPVMTLKLIKRPQGYSCKESVIAPSPFAKRKTIKASPKIIIGVVIILNGVNKGPFGFKEERRNFNLFIFF